MGEKVLHIDPQKCTGCMQCEGVCAVWCSASGNPSVSRIRVLKWEGSLFVPMACRQCEEAPCMAVCPKEALYRDGALNRVMVDYTRCISCRMCVAACPFGAMGFDAGRQRVFKCDLCDGDPRCVRFCLPGALSYTASETVQYRRIRHAAQKQAPIKEATHVLLSSE